MPDEAGGSNPLPLPLGELGMIRWLAGAKPLLPTRHCCGRTAFFVNKRHNKEKHDCGSSVSRVPMYP